MQIGRKDIVWNFAATFMRVASGLIVLPLVLNRLSQDEVGVWNLFLQVGGLALLLDFGFMNSFGRNITYIFSGVKELKEKGYVAVDQNDKTIDYNLLKSVIKAMQKYYGILALVFMVLFAIISPYYLSVVLRNYHGNANEIWISWFIYGFLIAYQLYTYYYSSLLSGRGMVKKLQQITIIGQASRISLQFILLLMGYGIVSLVVGQLLSDIVNRYLCYRAFYDHDIRKKIKAAITIPVNKIMKVMTPNAVRIGVTTLGWFMLTKITILIAPLIGVNLPTVGSYGTTKQIIDLIMSLGSLWFATFYPKITLNMVNEYSQDLKRMYIKSKLSLILVFLVCGAGLILVVPVFFRLLHSQTQLLPWFMIIVMLFFAFLDSNQSISSSFLLAGNEVPFMKSSLIAGFISTISLLILLKFTDMGTWALILSPALAMSVYQNWKWPLVVARKLSLRPSDYFLTGINTLKEFRIKKKHHEQAQ